MSLEDSETSPDLEGVAGLKPMNGQPRPRSRHASKVSENDAMFILHQLGASQLTTSSSEESASTTSLDHSEGSYQRRQTMPIMNTELIPHPTRSNSLIPSVGDKDHLQRRQMRIVRTSSPLPRLVEESEKKSKDLKHGACARARACVCVCTLILSSLLQENALSENCPSLQEDVM